MCLHQWLDSMRKFIWRKLINHEGCVDTMNVAYFPSLIAEYRRCYTYKHDLLWQTYTFTLWINVDTVQHRIFTRHCIHLCTLFTSISVCFFNFYTYIRQFYSISEEFALDSSRDRMQYPKIFSVRKCHVIGIFIHPI